MQPPGMVSLLALLSAGLCFSASLRAQTVPPPGERERPGDGSTLFDWHDQRETGPLHSPWSYGWYDYYDAGYRVGLHIGRRELDGAVRRGRATERYRQNVLELRRALHERLQYSHRGRTSSGRPELGSPSYVSSHGAGRFGRFGPGPYGSYSLLRDLHEQGRELEYYRQQELHLREQLTLLSYRDLFDRGLELFRAGSYGQAARAFAAAADKDRQDAAARLHAAQALTAVGMYGEAMAHVRRAFELQPQLLYLPMNLADDYDDQGDYAEHLAALAAHVQAHPADHEAAVLLAYQRFFGPTPQDAAQAMQRIKPLARKDPFVTKLLAAAAPLIPDAR